MHSALTHVERAEGAQPVADQVAVHGAGGQDHRHRDPPRPGMLVGQHDMSRTRAHRVLGLGPDPRQPLAQRAGPRREAAVDLDQRRVELRHQHVPLRIGHEGAFQHDDLGLAAVLVEHVLEVAEPGLQAHHPVFAQAVDRRVGHLAEILPEEMAERTVMLAEHRRGRVVAHRGQRLLAVLGHRRQDLLQLLDGIAGGDLTLAQLRPGEERRLAGPGQNRVGIVDLADPFAEGLRRREAVLDLGVVVEPALGHVDRQQLPRPQRALLLDLRFVHRHHPGLGARDHQPVAGHHIAHRAQTVAVQPGADPAPVGHRQGGRPVPGLHHRVAVGIHVAPGLGQLHRLLGPAFGHQHGLGHRRRAPGPHQHLEDRIQRRAVGRPARDDRLDVLGHLPEGRAGHADLVALHPVDVAASGC